MAEPMPRFRGFLRAVGWAELCLAALLLAGVVASICAQVASRYLFNKPLIWVEEGVVYAFVWMVFLGASAGLKAQRHVRIEWLSRLSGPRLRAILFMLGQAAPLAIAAMILPPALRIMEIESRSMSVSLPWELPRFLFFSLPLAVCFSLLALTSIYFLAAGLIAFRRGGAVEPIIALRDDEDENREAASKLAGPT